LESRINDPRGDHGQDEVAAAVGLGSEECVDVDFPRGTKGRGHMAMR
jgi:hypothetical protein